MEYKNNEFVSSYTLADEDRYKLKYSVLNESSDVLRAELDGDALTLQDKKLGGSTITITCDDSKGGTVSTNIKVNAFFVDYIIYGIIFLILIVVLFIINL